MSITYIQKAENILTRQSRHTITWIIPNVLELLFTKNEYHPNYDSSCKLKFQLKIRFCFENNSIECFYLSLNSVIVKAIVSIVKKKNDFADPESIIILADNEYQTVYANTWQYIATLYESDSVKQKKLSKLVSFDGNLGIKFKFIIFNDAIVKPIIEEVVPQFVDNFEDLFISGLYSDVVMKAADDVEYKVHKAVLASRSAVLKAHFEHKTIECQTNVVSSHLDSDVLKEVLMFIYSGNALRVDEIPEKLLAAGDYYQLGKLKNLASKALYEKLTVDNAIETLQVADLYSVPNLKKLTLEYIKSNCASSITGTEGWSNLNSVELTKTLYEYITIC